MPGTDGIEDVVKVTRWVRMWVTWRSPPPPAGSSLPTRSTALTSPQWRVGPSPTARPPEYAIQYQGFTILQPMYLASLPRARRLLTRDRERGAWDRFRCRVWGTVRAWAGRCPARDRWPHDSPQHCNTPHHQTPTQPQQVLRVESYLGAIAIWYVESTSVSVSSSGMTGMSEWSRNSSIFQSPGNKSWTLLSYLALKRAKPMQLSVGVLKDRKYWNS